MPTQSRGHATRKVKLTQCPVTADLVSSMPLAYATLLMVIVETTVFTRQLVNLLTDDEYRELQVALASRPDAGRLIVGGGGLRKVRWAGKGRGKRGGVRVIYYWAVEKDRLLMLLVYAKNVRDDLSTDQLKTLKRIVEDQFP